MRNKIPNNIKQLREFFKLSQKDLAKKMGLSYARIGQWERGEMMPGLVNVFKLGLIFNATPQDIYKDLFDDLKKRIENGESISDLLQLQYS
jgi:transcriptional regulator with XRE-family HTH domain